MFFEDYTKTGLIYHVVHITDLKEVLRNGINYDDKNSYNRWYLSFHKFIDQHRIPEIPSWVQRKKAIFASMNYRNSPGFHSHSAVLGLKVEESKCWVANENKANQIYEPFILKEIYDFERSENYLKTEGKKILTDYWKTSLSFEKNLLYRRDLEEDYDAEVMIFHPIPPEDIQLLYIVSDHQVLTVEEWRKVFCI